MWLQDDPIANLLTRLLTHSMLGRSTGLRYGYALGLVLFGCAVRALLPLDSAPYLPFMPLVFLAGLFFGKGPGWLATGLSAIVALAITMVHAGGELPAPADWIGFLLFLTLYSGLVVICDLLRRLIIAREEDLATLKAAATQQRLLNHELGHRLKNTLALVQVIASQTFRRAASLAEGTELFQKRLIALSQAHDILTEVSWEKAELTKVIEKALAPHGLEAGRFKIGGPYLEVSSRCSLALALAIHELATNAAKYGALSVEAGRVGITWVCQEEPGQLVLRWQESGGPPVAPPTHKGFGSTMVERALSGYFQGTAAIDYLPAGICFTLIAPITASADDFHAGKADVLRSAAG